MASNYNTGSTKIVIPDLAKLVQKLNDVGEKLSSDRLMKVVLAGAAAIESFSKQNASGRPGPRVQTGALRGGIHVEPGATSDTSAEAAIGPTVEYAPYLEFGTVHAPPYPFMRPAVDGKEDAIAKPMGAEVVRQLRELEEG